MARRWGQKRKCPVTRGCLRWFLASTFPSLTSTFEAKAMDVPPNRPAPSLGAVDLAFASSAGLPCVVFRRFQITWGGEVSEGFSTLVSEEQQDNKLDLEMSSATWHKRCLLPGVLACVSSVSMSVLSISATLLRRHCLPGRCWTRSASRVQTVPSAQSIFGCALIRSLGSLEESQERSSED